MRGAEPSDIVRSVSRALRVLEAVGSHPGGLTVKQVARRCELTPATAYHLIRTLAYEGYVVRREDGAYVVGLEVADRFRELVLALKPPASVIDAMRRASQETGLSFYLGTFVGGRVAVTGAVEGPRSPRLEEFLPGFDEAAHATALGKALLATMTPTERHEYLQEHGLRAYTARTLVNGEALEADLLAGRRGGMQVEVGQFRAEIACAAVVARAHPDPTRRLVLATALPVRGFAGRSSRVRQHLLSAAAQIAALPAT